MSRSIPGVPALLTAVLFASPGSPAAVPGTDAGSAASHPAEAAPSLGKLPLYFTENRGQLDPSVSYYVQGSTTAAYFTPQGITLALTRPAAGSGGKEQPVARMSSLRTRAEGGTEALGAGTRAVVALDFVGARRGIKPEGGDEAEAVVSYFKGSPDRWKAGLRTYSSVIYREVWPGIDAITTGTASQMEYTFVVRPGADPRHIRLRYRGASSVRLDATGALAVTTTAGAFRDQAPVAFQDIDGRRVEVTSAYAPRKAGAGFDFAFKIGRYDRTRPLVIDPVVLVYCGYIGGDGSDWGTGIALDSDGNAYVAGMTGSLATSFPLTVGPDLSYNGGDSDAFVAKVRADGTGLIYAGYIGGDDFDVARGLAVDAAGNAYVTGLTYSTQATFPVVIGPNLTYNDAGTGPDAFVAKVRADGTGLVYAGYIGGGGQDEGQAIAVDAIGSAYITGYSASSEATFPVAVGPDLSLSDSFWGDAFVAKVRADGSGLVYAGYIGGDASDSATGVAVDGTGSAYVTGYTTSSEATFPVTVGPDVTFNGGGPLGDAYVAKVTADGTGLVYAGYIGGSGSEYAGGIRVDDAGSAYVTGDTTSSDGTFPVIVGPDLTFNGGSDAFVAKLRPDGSGLTFSGYIGGSGVESGYGIGIDDTGHAYVTGRTSSWESTFPVTVGPGQTFNGTYDAYVARLKADGSGLDYAGYIGGAGEDGGWAIAVDTAGSAYVVGWTEADETTFPVSVGPDATYNWGPFDAFVAKVAVSSCVRGSLVPPPMLLGVKAGGATGASFAWEPDPAAAEYHLNTVAAKGFLRDTDPTSPREAPAGQGQNQCSVLAPTLTCSDTDAIADPSRLLFYQVLAACGPSGSDEGPICTASAPCP